MYIFVQLSTNMPWAIFPCGFG